MAKVTMDFYDLDDYELPDVCMVCGALAEERKGKLYSWYHPALNLLIFGMLPGWIALAVLSNVLAKRRKVQRPLCEKHIKQWPWRTFITVGGFVLFALVGFAAIVVLANSRVGQPNELGGILCIGTFAVLLVWLIVVIVLQSSVIRPSEITDDSITLVNVSKKFALAYEDEIEQAPRSRIDDEVRARSRDGGRGRQAKPKPKRPASDAFEPE